MKTKQKSGLTLIELMITTFAAGTLAITVALVLMMAFRSWRMNNAFADLRRHATLATEMMARDIRESAITNVTATVGQLDLTANRVRSDDIRYTQTGDTLIYTTTGGDSMTVIPENLTYFETQANAAGDGVYVDLSLMDPAFNIGVTNQVFINTRN